MYVHTYVQVPATLAAASIVGYTPLVQLVAGDYAVVRIDEATGHTLRGQPVARTTLVEHTRYYYMHAVTFTYECTTFCDTLQLVWSRAVQGLSMQYYQLHCDSVVMFTNDACCYGVSHAVLCFGVMLRRWQQQQQQQRDSEHFTTHGAAMLAA
jgi:hypothetical protein